MKDSRLRTLLFIVLSRSLIIAYVIERVFALERGLSVLEIEILIITYSLVSLICEIPAGIIADRWRKKYALALGLFLSVFEFALCAMARDFPLFLAAFAITAVGEALISGTDVSLLYEILDEKGEKEKYSRYLGMFKALSYWGSGAIGILGGYTAHYFGLEFNYWVSCIPILAGVLAALTLKEERRTFKESERAIHHFKKALASLKKNPVLFISMIWGALTGAILYGVVDEMTGLTFLELEIPVYLFGYLILLQTLAGGLSGLVIPYLRKKMKLCTLLIVISASSALFIGLYSFASSPIFIIFLLAGLFTMEMSEPLITDLIQKKSSDEHRVTLQSLSSFMLNGFIIPAGLIFGMVSDSLGVFRGYGIMALLLMILSVTIIPFKKRINSAH